MPFFSSLRILGWVLLALLALGAAAPAHATDPLPAGGGTTATGQIPSQRPCAQAERLTNAQRRGLAQQSGLNSTINDAMLRSFDAAALIMAGCIDRIIQLVSSVRANIETARAGFLPAAVAAVAIILGQIAAQMFNQIIDNIVNAVCNVADQVFSFLSSMRNLICIPQAQAIDPFSFDINLNALECDGWSIDLLNGNVIGSPVEGLNVDLRNLGQRARELSTPAPEQPGAPIYAPGQTPPNSDDSSMDDLIGIIY